MEEKIIIKNLEDLKSYNEKLRANTMKLNQELKLHRKKLQHLKVEGVQLKANPLINRKERELPNINYSAFIVNNCEVLHDPLKATRNVFKELSGIFPINVLADNGTPLKIALNGSEVITSGKGQQFRTILNYDPYTKKFHLTHLNKKTICKFDLETIKNNRHE